ncbi:MAG TPA: hypothetical protein DCS59_03160 [Eubacterium sp.]|nr:hypothetical protein [Eubacterium sp.]
MKNKLLIFLMTLCMMLSLAACAGNRDAGGSKSESGGSSSVAADKGSSVDEKETSSETEADSSESDQGFSPMEVQENGEVQMDEDETFEIH